MSALVYVVEADPASQTVIDRVLEARRYQSPYGRADGTLEKMPNRERAGCIVVDMEARDAAVRDPSDRLLKTGPNLLLIFLAEHSDVPAGVLAIRAWAEDFFTRPVEREEFVRAIERAIARHRLANEREGWVDTLTARMQRLTRRERQVFELVARGRMNKQVAFELGLTERTVKAHRRKVMEKMQLRSAFELVSCGERLCLSSDSV